MSAGFVRQRMDGNVVVMPPGKTTPAVAAPVALLQMRANELATEGSAALATVSVREETTTVAVVAELSDADQRALARMKGYEGEMCGECGNYTMVRNGTCLKCDTCGSTSGCS
jgi:ribonucleoside-diphosphate reductase alpha chain